MNENSITTDLTAEVESAAAESETGVPEMANEQSVSGEETPEYGEIAGLLKRIESLQQTNNRELNEMNRKYHNCFADVINRQQAEIDAFREGLGRNAVNSILKAVSGLYSEYEQYLQCGDPQRIKKGLDSLLDELLQLLHENGVSEYKSTVGEEYSVKFCKPFEKIKTDDKELHRTVVESRNIGFYIDKTVLVPERVKIYVYDETCADKETEE